MNKDFLIKNIALIWYSFHFAVHNLLLRYARARNVQNMFFSSVAVFFSEILKVSFCLIIISTEEGGIFKRIKTQIIEQPRDTLKVCIPAILYTVQNNLSYIAATHLEAATYAIVSQLKIFAAVVFSIIILKQHQSWMQWFSFLILFVGVSLVQLQTNESTSKFSNPDQNPILGFFVTCIACIISSFAGIFLEKILKGSAPVSIWMRNVQMAIFGIPASLFVTLIQNGPEIMEHGILFGFDSIVWLTVVWYGIGGLAAAICLKYASTIAKDFATSFGIILSTLGSVYFFSFVPSLIFIFGAFLVIFSILLYSSSEKISKIFLKYQPINDA